MKRLLLAAALMFPLACGPDWGDCVTCRPGEDSSESVDGSEQIPNDTDVTVIVIVDQDQTQTQDQTQSTPPVVPPPSTTPDAGTPSGTTCRKVCKCVKRTYDCGKKHGHKKSCKKKDKCVKETVKCS